MIIDVSKPKYVDIKPGDKVKIDYWYRCRLQSKFVTIKRLVETDHGEYAVLSNHTWRPISTYGYTWKKVAE